MGQGSKFSNGLRENGYYIPMTIQDIDQDTGGYILEGFIATNDELSQNEEVVITHGIFDTTGAEADALALPIDNCLLEINALYRNPLYNQSSKYRNFYGLDNLSLT